MTEPYQSPDGSHRHECYACGCIWEHGESCLGLFRPHRCPECGTEVFWKYTGPKVPSHVNHHRPREAKL